MKLRFTGGKFQGRIVDLDGSLVIGRGEDTGLLLDEEGVSRQHCRFYESDGQWLVEDLDSMNGIRVNGHRISAPTILKPGDRVSICQNTFLFTDGNEPPPPAPVTEAGAAAAPAAARPDLGTEVDDGDVPNAPPRKSSDEDQPAEIPWGRLSLLAVVLVLVGVFAFLVVAPDTQPEPGDNGDDMQIARDTDEPPAKVDAPELSDAELQALIDQEDQRAADGDGEEPTRDGDGQTDTDGPADSGDGDPPPPPDPDPGSEVRPGPEPQPVHTGAVVDLVLLESIPTGAAILVDEQERGHTPVVLRDLSGGRHMVTLRADGYEDYTRQIHVPDALPNGPYRLRQEPGTVLITSEPPGAGIWHGTQLLGTTPIMVKHLPPGDHDVRMTAFGHQPMKVTFSVSRVAGTERHVKMPSVVGALDVVTTPPGCTVNLDGFLKGHTPTSEDGGRTSAPLRLNGLEEGEHVLRLEHPNGKPRVGRVRIRRGQTIDVRLKLWIIDTKVTLTDGTIKTGMLAEKNDYGDVVLEEAPKRFQRYLKPQVAEVSALSAEEAARLLSTGAEAPEDEPEHDAPPPDNDDGHWGDAPAPEPDREGDAFVEDGRADDEPPPRDLALTVSELMDQLRGHSKTEMHRRYTGKTLRLEGVPTSSRRDGLGGYVNFGRRIRCAMSAGEYEEAREALRGAEDTETPIRISGTVVGLQGDMIVIRSCKLLSRVQPTQP